MQKLRFGKSSIVQLIRQGQRRVAAEVNATVVLLYWTIGRRINDEILTDKRAEYGDQIIDSVSVQLSQQFGKGYSRSALFRRVRFAKPYTDSRYSVATIIMVSCCATLSNGPNLTVRVTKGHFGAINNSHMFIL